MPSIPTPTVTFIAADGEVVPLDANLAQNIGRQELTAGSFVITAPEGVNISASISLGATRFDPIPGPIDNVVEAQGRGLREQGALAFDGNFNIRLSLVNPDGSPVRDADGAPVRDSFQVPVSIQNDFNGQDIARNPNIGEGAPAPVDPAPVDPAPVDPAPVDPAPVDPAPVDPAPVDPAPVNVINGGNGRDRLNGTNDADEINGNRGNDVINGRGGDDIIDGGAGRDNIRGGAGDDTIDGGRGNDNIRGGGGDDVIEGGAGRDVIRGGNGNDTIDGGTGNDVLFGGRGTDTFVFANNSGRDVIRDFASNDQIDLSEVATLNSIEDVAGALTQTRSGTVLDLGGGDTVLLQNVDISSLQVDDFLF